MSAVRNQLLLSLAILVGLPLVLEGGARLGERVYYGAPWTELGPAGLYDPASTDGPRLVPGAALDGLRTRVRINAQGTRGRDLLEPRPEDLVRIWCTGGSTTFDIYAPDDVAAWPARVDALLSVRRDGPRTEVVNAGIPGATLDVNRARFLQSFDALRPDVLVIHAGPNDIRRVAVADLPAQAASPARHLALLRVLSRLAPTTTELPAWTERRFPGVQPIREELERFVDDAQARGLAVVLATHAHRAADDLHGDAARQAVAEGMAMHALGAEEVIAAYAQYNAMVRDLARQRGLPLAEVRQAVPPDPQYFGDATHFVPAGSSLAAREVAAALVPVLDAIAAARAEPPPAEPPPAEPPPTEPPPIEPPPAERP